jgi:amino acid adenylation domain-containing protein
VTALAPLTPARLELGAAAWSQPSYHVVRCLRLEGEFDVQTAHSALRLLTERHAVLRAVLPAAFAVPAPRPAPRGAMKVDFAESRVSREEATGHAIREATEPFDLARGPLLRVRALRVTDRECFLMAVAHRLALDLAALDAFLVEHALAYTAARLGASVSGTVADPRWHSADAVAADREYWLNRLAALPALDLPTDRPRQPRKIRSGGAERFILPTGLARRLLDLSGTPEGHSALCAGVVVLLARHTAQRALPLLVPVRPPSAGADAPLGRPETDVVLTFRLDAGQAFQDVVEQARAELAEARAHADALPPGALADVTGACGDPGRQPVPVRFAARRSAATLPDYLGASCTRVDLHLGVAARDLSLTFDMQGSDLRGALEYDTGLFEPVTAQRMVRRLEHLLAEAMENPRAPVAALSILPPDERTLVVSVWNRTERPFPRDRTASSLFEDQVSRDPDALAVEHDDVRLSYGELNVRANRIAHRLIEWGVGPDAPVGLCLPRSIDMVVSLLAILKAGGAYLPLDPEHPAQRLAYVAETAEARVILTDTAHADAFAARGVRVLCLGAPDTANLEVARCPATDPVVSTSAEHLAYIIYTSGSTGVPKGVAVTHRALSRLVKGANYARLGPGEVHLQLSPLSFDASLLELWGPLLNGGTLVLPPSGLPFLDELKAALQRHRITTLALVSPQLHVAAEQFPEKLGRVRQLLVGGDVLSPASVARLLPYLGNSRFVHLYGPTECTLFATWKPVEAVDTSRATIPIGGPIANTQAYVLDDDLSPLPIGIPGDLWLGGDGLARGYLGRPDLTAERFLADPFGPPGGRIYRTGDLARWLPDGDLEFLGRSDDQVKIRGYRIELGELDAALAAHPNIRAVSTVVRNDAPGGQFLAAYLVGDTRLSGAELREYMGSRVPSHMIPAAFVWVDEIPLTANGKVDRNALPAPTFGAGRQQHASPRTPLEGRVLGVIAETLGLDAVGPDEDFFELGGNSLLMVELFTRLEKLLPGRGLSLVDLLENRTGARITALVESPRTDA